MDTARKIARQARQTPDASTSEIAGKYGVSRQYVHRVLVREGLNRVPIYVTQRTADELSRMGGNATEAIEMLLEDGMSGNATEL